VPACHLSAVTEGRSLKRRPRGKPKLGRGLELIVGGHSHPRRRWILVLRRFREADATSGRNREYIGRYRAVSHILGTAGHRRASSIRCTTTVR